MSDLNQVIVRFVNLKQITGTDYINFFVQKVRFHQIISLHGWSDNTGLFIRHSFSQINSQLLFICYKNGFAFQQYNAD